jgi:CrcB protein
MKEIALVGFGGFIGACLRYSISNILFLPNKFAFPWNTLLINISGCFFLGVVLGLGLANNYIKEFIIIGVLGGFTTFSTFGFEAYGLLNSGSYKLMFIYVISSSTIGILAVSIGQTIASMK